jgi:hypothetical protein
LFKPAALLQIIIRPKTYQVVAMALTKRETIYVGGRPVDVHFFEGLSKETAPLVVAVMEGPTTPTLMLTRRTS